MHYGGLTGGVVSTTTIIIHQKTGNIPDVMLTLAVVASSSLVPHVVSGLLVLSSSLDNQV